MEIKQDNLVKEISTIQKLLDCMYDGVADINDPVKKEWTFRHLYMVASRLGTMYSLLKEGD